MPAATAPSAAEISRALGRAREQLAGVLRALETVEAAARLDTLATVIRRLDSLRDLAEVLAAMAMQLEVFARDRITEASALLAVSQLELHAGEEGEDPDGR